MNVGSLYYVDSGLKDFKTTCHARAAELGEDVIESRSWDIEKTLERLDTGVSIDFGPVTNRRVGDPSIGPPAASGIIAFQCLNELFRIDRQSLPLRQWQWDSRRRAILTSSGSTLFWLSYRSGPL
jgi:hypothetical protein